MRELQKIDGKVGTDCTTACRGPKFFQFYRQWVYPFNPILVDMGRFELDLFTYLNAYAAVEFESHSKSDKWTIDRSIAHISLLLATLSAGAYYSDLDLPQQSYICHDLARRSFQALRLANFLFRPSLDVVQALLVLDNMFQNNGQSDAAWALLGTTVRLAQTIGLHTERSIAYLPQYMQLKAKTLCMLSLCYDRPPIVFVRSSASLSFTDVIHYLCRLGIEVTTADRDTQETTFYLNILNHLEYVDQRSLPHLTSLQNCKSMHDNLERLELKMHFYLVVAVLTRPALKQSQIQDQLYGILRERAKASIIDASRAFLDFQALSVVPLRTWSMGSLRKFGLSGLLFDKDDLVQFLRALPDTPRSLHLSLLYFLNHGGTWASLLAKMRDMIAKPGCRAAPETGNRKSVYGNGPNPFKGISLYVAIGVGILGGGFDPAYDWLNVRAVNLREGGIRS
ncbi:hypothetical protein CA14_001335 [Aspergillus flavus]|uniref:Xylanolytic transcriptional activator regulatory domain-containing protein n=1 Tax=Aspergillus flavus TaxID=5059 RepID=A0AB74C4T9_ASPFL|nr:hypothetical protein CA14_001335 [Aspergillus flavus]